MGLKKELGTSFPLLQLTILKTSKNKPGISNRELSKDKAKTFSMPAILYKSKDSGENQLEAF